MVFSALPLTPSISAEAAVITSYEKTGYYDFTSDYVVGTTGHNAISGYIGDSFQMYAKAWDRVYNVKTGDNRKNETDTGTLDYVYNAFGSVVDVTSNVTKTFPYNTKESEPTTPNNNVTTSIDGLYFNDGLIYLPNVGDYVDNNNNNNGFRISWTEQYFTKDNDVAAGVFYISCDDEYGLGEIDLFRWNTSSFYYGNAFVKNCSPVDSHVYNISLTGDSNGYITVKVYDATTSSNVINYTSTSPVSYSAIKKLAIGTGNFSLAELGKFAISNLTIEKASTETTSTTTTAVCNSSNLTLRWLASSDYTNDASVNDRRAVPNRAIYWGNTNTYAAADFTNTNTYMNYRVSSNLMSEGLTASCESGGAGTTIAFMAYSSNTDNVPFFCIYNTNYNTNGYKTVFSLAPSGNIVYANSSGKTNHKTISSVSTNAWHTYVIRFISSTTLQIYIDGVQKFSTKSDYYDNHTFDVPNVVQIGTNREKNAYFTGSIRDFRIYNTAVDPTTLHNNLNTIAEETKQTAIVNSITSNGAGVVGNTVNNRVNSSTGINIVNDGQNNSTDVGILSFDLSAFNGGYRATSNSVLYLNILKTWFSEKSKSVSSYSQYDDMYTDVYYSISDLSGYVNSSGTACTNNYSGFNYTTTTQDQILQNVSYFGASSYTKLGSVHHSVVGECDGINIADAINFALDNNKTTLYIILVKSKYDNTTGEPWTDTHFVYTNQTINCEMEYNCNFVNAAGQVVRTVKAINPTEACKYSPANTSDKIVSNANGTHSITKYSWALAPTNNIVSEESSQSTVNCSGGTATCQSRAICSVCKQEYGDLGQHSFANLKIRHKNFEGDNNGYDYISCDNCDVEDPNSVKNRVYDDQSKYWDTYGKALADAKTKIANTAKYTSESINKVQEVIDSVPENDPTKSKSYIEGRTTALTTEVSKLVLRQYSITVKYVDELGNDLKVGEEGATSKIYPAVDYGSILNVVAPTNYNKVDYAVYKWTREDKSNSSISGLNSSSLDVVVKGASTYYVFLKKTSVDSSQVGGDSFAITLNNKSNKVVDIGYATKTEFATVTISGNDITVGDVKLTAPNYSFYEVKGFTINGNPVADGDTIAINSNMVIKPEYKAKQSVRITRASRDIRINGDDIGFVDVDWNKKIVMTYKGAVPDGKVVIWKDGNGNILAQGTTYSFYANSNVTISASVEDSAPTDPTASIGMFSYDPTDNKVTVVNNFYVPEGMKAVKAGVVLSTKTDNIDTLKEQKTGRFEGTADKFSGTDTNKNQIRISVTRTATTSFTMHALAYVVVEDKNGNTETYYAPTVRSITYPANTTA